MKLLTNGKQKSYENAKICYICDKDLRINMLKIKNIVMVGIIVIIQGNIEALQIAYVT